MTAAEMAVDGIWTPWAAVWCMRCHGPTFKGRGPDGADTHCTGDDWDERTTPREWDTLANEAIGVCDKCECAVWVRDDVALCQRAVAIVNNNAPDMVAWLSQLGGMTCGAHVEPKIARGETHGYILITPSEEINDAEALWVGVYDDNDENGEQMDGKIHDVDGDKPNDVIALCRRLFKDNGIAMGDGLSLVNMIKHEIIADMFRGDVPGDVATFGDLHDHVDANMYGDGHTDRLTAWDNTGTDRDPDAEAYCAVFNDAADAVDEWIRAGGPRDTILKMLVGVSS